MGARCLCLFAGLVPGLLSHPEATASEALLSLGWGGTATQPFVEGRASGEGAGRSFLPLPSFQRAPTILSSSLHIPSLCLCSLAFSPKQDSVSFPCKDTICVGLRIPSHPHLIQPYLNSNSKDPIAK